MFSIISESVFGVFGILELVGFFVCLFGWFGGLCFLFGLVCFQDFLLKVIPFLLPSLPPSLHFFLLSFVCVCGVLFGFVLLFLR